LRHQTMDKVQKYNSFNTNTPSSESYRNYFRPLSLPMFYSRVILPYIQCYIISDVDTMPWNKWNNFHCHRSKSGSRITKTTSKVWTPAAMRLDYVLNIAVGEVATWSWRCG